MATRSGAEFAVAASLTGSQSQPAIARLADGGFVLTWTDNSRAGSDVSGDAVRAQVFSAAGIPVRAAFEVNTTTFSNQRQPAVAALADGGFAIVWRDESTTGPRVEIEQPWQVRARFFDGDGTARGGEIVIGTSVEYRMRPLGGSPVVAALADGRVVVAWESRRAVGDTSDAGIMAQILDPDGSAAGAPFRVNAVTRFNQWNPAIAALPRAASSLRGTTGAGRWTSIPPARSAPAPSTAAECRSGASRWSTPRASTGCRNPRLRPWAAGAW
jgi:hypothetical protein